MASFLAAYLAFILAAAVWEFSGGIASLHTSIGGHLLRNIALVLPAVVYVLFHSAMPCLGANLQGLLYKRQLAVPPTLLLWDERHIARLALEGVHPVTIAAKLTRVSFCRYSSPCTVHYPYPSHHLQS